MADLVIEGWDELKPRLLELPDKLVKSILDYGMRQGANAVRDEVKGRCPVITGALRDSIRTVKRRGTRDTVRYNVVAGTPPGARREAAYGGDASAYYALWVEKGHGGITGPAAPHPFMLPGLEATSQLAIDFVSTGISDRLEELAK